MHTRSYSGIAAVLLVCLVAAEATVAQAAPDPVAKCQSSKLKAAGKYLKSALTCHSKAAASSIQPSAGCIATAAQKLNDAVLKAGVLCNGDYPVMLTGLDSQLADVVDEIVPLGHGVSAGKCESQKLKAAGTHASGRLKAEAGNITKPDATKLVDKLAKEAAKLATKVVKADSLGGCETVGNAAGIQTLSDAAGDATLGCIAGSEACDGLSTVGSTADTDDEADGATTLDPVETFVSSPNSGSITIFEGPVTQAPVGAFEFFGQQIDITAPAGTAGSPLVIVFRLDASIVTVPAAQVQIFKSGTLVPDCTGPFGTAAPDPCVFDRALQGDGDVSIAVFTSTASPWNPATSLGCPDLMIWETEADDGIATTASRHDSGSAGHFHDQFPLDGAKLPLALACSPTPPCAPCAVTGVIPTDTCRCANDTRTICDAPASVDNDDCGGAMCRCYTSPPEPLHGGNTPVCSVLRLDSQPSGTWDPATGSGDVTLDETWNIYLGISLTQPCPVCVGDATPGDGIRAGTCNGGEHDGQTCDAQASDASYPAPGGGDYSLDCMPSNVQLITGVGIDRSATHTTGSAPSISRNLSCTFGFDLCHCGRCSLDNAVGCASNTDCAAVSAGTCAAATSQSANSCSDGICTDIGGGEGICDVPSPPDLYCDGYLRVDGTGFAKCLSNADCVANGPGFGDCTIAQIHECFLDPITAAGTPHVTTPVTAATKCVGTSSSGAVNSAFGLAGPIRLTTQRAVSYEQGNCPNAMLWETSADDGVTSTQTQHEIGSSGFFHHTAPLDEMQLQVDLTCSASSSPCGTCTVDGVMPEPGTCRCANDNRTVCNEPLVADADDCGGAVCRCYTSAPAPFSGGGTPACVLERLASDVTGTWNPDAGSGEILLDERMDIYTGITQQQPCPVCTGDPIPYDGVRGGTCNGGTNNTLSCDVHGSDASFPAPGGGDYSLDCFPIPGTLITGVGLPRPNAMTTGSDSLTANIPCLFSSSTCHCGICSLDSALGCTSNADCAAMSAGTCGTTGMFQAPNSCSDDTCVSVGGGQGECNVDADTYCDGQVLVDGSGIATCLNNSDCTALGGGWGDCTLVQARECFLGTISATGVADPTDPTTVAVTCLGTSSSSAVNSAVGLPGPARLVTERTLLTPY